MKVIVVGAGIVGASIAYHLAAAGAAVTVLDAGAVGAGASAKSFGWINASFAETPAYYRLRRAAIDRFRVLSQQLSLPSVGLPPWNHMLQIHHPRAFWAALKEPQTGMPSRVH